MESEEILLLDDVYEINEWEEVTLDINFPNALIDTTGYRCHITFEDLLAMCDPMGAQLS